MKKVKMLITISGGRHDGTAWPQAGETISVPDAEAMDLVRGGMAIPARDDMPEPESAPLPEQAAPDLAPSWDPAGTEPVTEPAPEPEPDPAVADPAEVDPEPDTSADPSAPKPAAPKADWVLWAMQRGASEEEASTSTKAQLMEKYGARA